MQNPGHRCQAHARVTPAAPLTHHQIIDLLPPFVARGQQVDLAASHRADRCLRFKPVEVHVDVPGGSGPQALSESLQLDCHVSGSFTLTRALRRADGLQATLRASGADVGELLARIDAVDGAQQFQQGHGFVVARSYVLPSAAAAPWLNEGVVQFDGLTLTLTMTLKDERGRAADIAIASADGETLDLPQDLLAVLGWDWSWLARTRERWTGKLRLRGSTPRRSRHAQAALDLAAGHLARVLAEAPARFHRRHVVARLGVVLRRSIPLGTAVGMVLGALWLTQVRVDGNAGLFMLLHYGSIVLLVLSFGLQEEARFEIPPWPHRSNAGSWRQAALRVNAGEVLAPAPASSSATGA